MFCPCENCMTYKKVILFRWDNVFVGDPQQISIQVEWRFLFGNSSMLINGISWVHPVFWLDHQKQDFPQACNIWVVAAQIWGCLFMFTAAPLCLQIRRNLGLLWYLANVLIDFQGWTTMAIPPHCPTSCLHQHLPSSKIAKCFKMLCKVVHLKQNKKKKQQNGCFDMFLHLPYALKWSSTQIF